MRTQVGVGTSTAADSREAGVQAAQESIKDLGARKPSIVIVYGAVGYDQREMLAGVTSVTGDAPLVGCSAEGTITQKGSVETNRTIAVMAIASDDMTFKTFLAQGLKENSEKAASDIASQVKRSGSDSAKLLMIFPDGLNISSTPFLSILESNLPAHMRIVGGGASDNATFQKTYQYFNGKVFEDSVPAVAIGGKIAVEIVVSHGCAPMGLERTVTKSNGRFLQEIDGKTAWSVFKEYLDGDPQTLQGSDVVHLCVAEKLPEKLSKIYDPYVIRGPLGLDEKSGGLFFHAEMPAGTKIKMSRRDPEKISQKAASSTQQIKTKHPGKSPLAVFQLDCAGRGRMIFGTRTNEMEVAPLQDAFGKTVPWIGFHTYGEIAPIGEKTFYHSFTVVLCALYEQ